ncbi:MULTISPECIES: hypothetical protein [Psychrilyobacter]|uniref:hypothetical protein n=1 Tax=Psychrilyobacter TaxID=623282 RepID=UPI001314643A|nr:MULTISPECIES: hypothetical protein [Psychrilyobacter]NDI78380.1 hypothetical protein [Psychrilyobacter piezotolerans]
MNIKINSNFRINFKYESQIRETEAKIVADKQMLWVIFLNIVLSPYLGFAFKINDCL